MATQRLNQATRIAQILLSLLLCCLVAVTAFAQRRDDRNGGRTEMSSRGPSAGTPAVSTPSAPQSPSLTVGRPSWVGRSRPELDTRKQYDNGGARPSSPVTAGSPQSPTLTVGRPENVGRSRPELDRRKEITNGGGTYRPPVVTPSAPPSVPRNDTGSNGGVSRGEYPRSQPVYQPRDPRSTNPGFKNPDYNGGQTPAAGAPGNSYRPPQKHDPVYQPPSVREPDRRDDRRGTNDDRNGRIGNPPTQDRDRQDRERRAEVDRRREVENRTSDLRHTNRHDDDHYQRPSFTTPKWFRAPTYRSGYYYYPTHNDSRRYHYGYWVFNDYTPSFCRRSVYYHFGYFPYIQIARIYVGSYVAVTYLSTPVVIHDTYYLARYTDGELDEALLDIRRGWTEGRLDLIDRHVTPGDRIAVLLDGRYDYSVDAEDYLQMTSDALEDVGTVSFTWDKVRERSDGGYTAFGRHIYRDESGTSRVVYVSYALRYYDGRYNIVEVGSSTSPLY